MGRDGTSAIHTQTEHDSGSKAPGKVNDHAKILSEHHDRLNRIETHLGLKPKGSINSEDQKATVKGDPAKHERESKGSVTKIYDRKRHP